MGSGRHNRPNFILPFIRPVPLSVPFLPHPSVPVRYPSVPKAQLRKSFICDVKQRITVIHQTFARTLYANASVNLIISHYSLHYLRQYLGHMFAFKGHATVNL